MFRVAFGMLAMAGIPYSRATTAPCDNIPPRSMTNPAACRKSGVHPGSVEGHTRMYPRSFGWTSPGSKSTRAGPVATPTEMPTPVYECVDEVCAVASDDNFSASESLKRTSGSSICSNASRCDLRSAMMRLKSSPLISRASSSGTR